MKKVIAEWDLEIAYPQLFLVREEERGTRAYHAIVGATFASKGHRFGAYAFVDDAVREHGLFCDAKDEGAEAVVVFRLRLLPHTLPSHQHTSRMTMPSRLSHISNY